MNRLRPMVIVVLAVVALWPTGAWPSVESEPLFGGFWVEKDKDGVGSFYYDMSWEGLVGRWKELGAQDQHLVDVEVYRRNGQERYAAVWRPGPGPGGLLMAQWNDFLKTWNDLKATQELI